MINREDSSLIDLKTTFRKDTGNIAIELSSFYWGLRLNMANTNFNYCYEDSTGEIFFFSPINNSPEIIFLQSKWLGTKAEKEFREYIKFILNKFELSDLIVNEQDTKGSKDPFIIKSILTINKIPLKNYLDTIAHKNLGSHSQLSLREGG